MIEPGSTVDDFTLQDDSGNSVQWSALRGAPVAVFFYPKASTPGCTQESCDFRDLSAEFGAIGVKVFGASADSVKRQASFRDKNELNMPLLSDPEHVILEPWGVWQEKKNYGRTYMGIVRSTFLFDADGVLVKTWPKVKVKGHAQEVLDAARELFA